MCVSVYVSVYVCIVSVCQCVGVCQCVRVSQYVCVHRGIKKQRRYDRLTFPSPLYLEHRKYERSIGQAFAIINSDMKY